MKFYKTFALAAVIVMSSTSCDKFLDLRPQDGITRDQFWQSKEQLQAAVIGIYNTINNSCTSQFFLYGELRADFISPGTPTAGENDIINNNIVSSNSVVNWASFYKVINQCNTVLDYGPGVKNVDNTLTDAVLNGYISEALTIRSLMYFYLVRTFRDVPLKLESTSNDEQIVRPAKSTAAEVLAQIVTDLKTAEGLAVTTYGLTPAFDKGRITKYTVNAIQADVYLWMDNYSECIAAADKVLNSGKFGLVPGLSWYGSIFVTGNSIESIFELQYDNQPGNLNPFFSMFQTTRPRFKANPIIVDNFYTLDPIDENNKDYRGLDVAIRLDNQTIAKYAVGGADASYRHWIMYRLADIMLLKAEACANSGRGQDALDIIATIRLRGNALAGSAESPAANSVDGITNYLLKERAREFAFEGKRWYDLLRNAKRNNFARRDLLISAALTSVPPISQQSALNKLKDNNSLYLPIPLSEIQSSPALVQNPFYIN